MADAGMMGGIGALAQGFLQGRQARIAQQQQDLAQQQYEFSKQQSAVDQAQKQQALEQQEEQNLSQYGSGGYEYMQALKSRGTSPQSQAQGFQAQPQTQDQNTPQPSAPNNGLTNYGNGYVPQQPGGGSPLSTVPSTNAQANPGVQQQPQQGPNGLPPSVQPQWMKQAQNAAKMAQLKEAQDMALKLKSQGGSADVVDDGKGGFTLSNVNQGPQAGAELNNALNGQRSASMAVKNQYNEDPAVKTVRGSQTNMAQMIDAYKNPSPYADASLVLNAYKIKFPNQSPDVNSIDELQKAQSVPDQWKNEITKALNGGFDQATRDNILRDGISTYRANVGSLAGAQQKAQAFAGQAGANGALITSEPSVMKTYQDAQNLQQQIGPYIPPTQQPGLMNSIKNTALNFLGGNTTGSSSASPGHPQDFQAVSWAKDHPKDPRAAKIMQLNGGSQ